MKYLSLFSGIEAATAAWKDLGWECVGVSEIDPFACEVLKQRYPKIKNFGDITKITKELLNELGTIDIVVGGSPCQSFSTGGKRKGLNDPRGKLMYEYIRMVKEIRPTWFIWENVVGVLSSERGRAFGTLLNEMANLGYSLCWRVLDAQYFRTPQRRRRVFLCGYIGADRERAAKVLFDPEMRGGDFTPGKATKQNITANVGTNTFCDVYNGLISKIAPTMTTATGITNGSGPKLITNNLIRRLTPLECERLQGFSDNHTRIKWRGKSKSQCPDGHRYKAIGNSMAVPVMKWIGNNIINYFK